MNTGFAAANERALPDEVLSLKVPEVPAPVYDITYRLPLDKWYNAWLKRATDIVVSAVLILVVFPWLLPLLAILITLDSKGPVFFLQKRHMRGGGIFTCIKFRTMVVNDSADQLPAGENDHRITRRGRLLRYYHLDELPQLVNVLMGHMSLVGPRPYMVTDNLQYEKLVANYAYRYKVKPGITGLAQSHGMYGHTSNAQLLRERLEMDCRYVREWTPGMDVKIILRTFRLTTALVRQQHHIG
ncbi:MAG TPA: sugar transferase [Flavisolibacter sp.]